MAPKRVQRKLTTIVSADVVGYSRLMAADEAGTFAQLKTHRKELLDLKTAECRGRTVKLTGDGALMEFASVVDAVRFAVEVQRAMVERNAQVPEDRRITYRVGINIGDIIVDGDDIYGDGVNVAARLQEMAEPGGVCVARNVFNQVKSKVDHQFEDLGEQALKNIPEPVRSYRIIVHPQEQVRQRFPTGGSASKRRLAIGAVIAACVIAVAILGWSVLDKRKTNLSEITCTDHLGLPVACPEGRE